VVGGKFFCSNNFLSVVFLTSGGFGQYAAGGGGGGGHCVAGLSKQGEESEVLLV